MAVEGNGDDAKYTGFSKYFNSYTIRGRSNWAKLWVSVYALSFITYKVIRSKSTEKEPLEHTVKQGSHQAEDSHASRRMADQPSHGHSHEKMSESKPIPQYPCCYPPPCYPCYPPPYFYPPSPPPFHGPNQGHPGMYYPPCPYPYYPYPPSPPNSGSHPPNNGNQHDNGEDHSTFSTRQGPQSYSTDYDTHDPTIHEDPSTYHEDPSTHHDLNDSPHLRSHLTPDSSKCLNRSNSAFFAPQSCPHYHPDQCQPELNNPYRDCGPKENSHVNIDPSSSSLKDVNANCYVPPSYLNQPK